ncbi:hypothetical protein B0H14DRAFT_2633020 [Mycena olivaceomarginata]|nr:hypothetical protein B0H14DRAFT_2633020 [Mycena olivaceomarginata]
MAATVGSTSGDGPTISTAQKFWHKGVLILYLTYGIYKFDFKVCQRSLHHPIVIIQLHTGLCPHHGRVGADVSHQMLMLSIPPACQKEAHTKLCLKRPPDAEHANADFLNLITLPYLVSPQTKVLRKYDSPLYHPSVGALGPTRNTNCNAPTTELGVYCTSCGLLAFLDYIVKLATAISRHTNGTPVHLPHRCGTAPNTIKLGARLFYDKFVNQLLVGLLFEAQTRDHTVLRGQTVLKLVHWGLQEIQFAMLQPLSLIQDLDSQRVRPGTPQQVRSTTVNNIVAILIGLSYAVGQVMADLKSGGPADAPWSTEQFKGKIVGSSREFELTGIDSINMGQGRGQGGVVQQF